ncbi:MAG: VanZ family protein [Porphyromonadaceae bacterium]|nr:VanZ family protein [Porphyromonadaceae bacterium]
MKKTLLKNWLKNYALTLVVIVVIVYLSLAKISTPTEIQKFPYADKAVHVIMYTILMLALYFDIHRRNLSEKSNHRHLFYGTLTAIAFGGIMELAQISLTRYRSGDWMDWIADAAGVLLGLWLGKPLLWLVSKCLPRWFNSK